MIAKRLGDHRTAVNIGSMASALCWVLGETFDSSDGKHSADFGALLNGLKRDFAVMDSLSN